MHIRPLHVSWGIGTLGASLLLNGFSFVVLFYLTTQLRIAAATAGALIAVAKLWEMVANPLTGWLSDRTESRWGRRRPYLLAGAVVASIAFAALYSTPPTLDQQTQLAYVAGALLLVGTGYTLFNVPYMAMPAEMVQSYQERSAMISWRVLFIGVGTLVGGGAARKIVELAGGGTTGYATFGMVIGAGILLCMTLCFVGTRHAPFTLRSIGHSLSFGEQWRLGLGNRPFLVLLGVKFVHLLGLASSTAGILFILRFTLRKENPGDWLLMYVAASSVLQIASIPVWLACARRFEKRYTYMLATAIFVAAALTWLVATPAERLEHFLLRAAVSGFAAGGMLLMGQSMLPDTIEYDYRRTGLRREGVFSGLYSFVEKAAYTLAPAITGFVLAYHDFAADAVGTPEAARGILVAAVLLPAGYFALSLPLLLGYQLTEERLKMTRPPGGSAAGAGS
ncbi:MAG: MFS transporter [Gammaproteobacteria bacterium]|nr:MFS transporter [Gammaproteobacteria bacterium]